MKKILFLLFLITLFTNVNYSQSISQHVKSIDSIMIIAQDRYNFNGTILVAENGEVIYKKSFGFSNFLTKEKLTTNSMFDLASISKAFTAMCIMILKENGKLEYEDDIQKYFPDLPYEGITIRHLLHHTSGLPDYGQMFSVIWDRNKIADNDDIWEMFEVHKPEVLFAPGEKYRYCNTGYAMLASIIEIVSGIPYRDFLRDNIFDKLSMNRTQVVNRRYRSEKINEYAYSHVFSISDGGYTFPDSVEASQYVYYLDGIVGDGCVNSTVEDMFKWDRALYTEKLVNKETLEEAFTPGTLNDSSKTNYGFGWRIKNTPNGKVFEHGGGWAGYINMFIRMVDKDQTLIVLTNNSFSAYGLFDCFINILNEEEFSLPPIDFVFEIRKGLVNNDMGSLQNKIEPMLKDSINYRFTENSINNLGYELLSITRYEEAIELFQLNTNLFPESANTFDSLAEAYMVSGDKENAIKYYKKALEVDPNFENSQKMLKKLQEEK
ncbi:MAG: serine hydrolase [Ignavibacteria bacterium]|nr:serine hydrolase [Ignavibacteria bacterium]